VGTGGAAPKFLPSLLSRSEWSASRFDRFFPWKRAAGTQWIGGRLAPGAGLDAVEERRKYCHSGNRTGAAQHAARRYIE
jgi:hypothetical protein